MYEISETNDEVILVLSDQVSISETAGLRKELQALDAARDLTVDASALEYIDSSGVACLIMAYTACAKNGAKVVLKNPSDALMRVLETLKFSSFFPVI